MCDNYTPASATFALDLLVLANVSARAQDTKALLLVVLARSAAATSDTLGLELLVLANVCARAQDTSALIFWCSQMCLPGHRTQLFFCLLCSHEAAAATSDTLGLELLVLADADTAANDT